MSDYINTSTKLTTPSSTVTLTCPVLPAAIASASTLTTTSASRATLPTRLGTTSTLMTLTVNGAKPSLGSHQHHHSLLLSRPGSSQSPERLMTMHPTTPTTLKPLLKSLMECSIARTKPSVLTIESVIHHLSTPDGFLPSQAGAILATVSANEWDKDAELIAACAQVLRSKAVEPTWAASHSGPRCDLVGTGGDGHNTFNVSTSAALVVAGVGIKVAKHGNRASSSSSGSADFLMALDIPIASVPPAFLPPPSEQSCLTFLFASLYHPALGAIAPIRRELGLPTIFNILGPLINPARPTHMVVGVAKASLGPAYIEALARLGVVRAWVVCGREGLDEISPAGETDVWDYDSVRPGQSFVGKVIHRVVSPATFGLPCHPLSDVVGGPSDMNASIFLNLIGESPTSTSTVATTSRDHVHDHHLNGHHDDDSADGNDDAADEQHSRQQRQREAIKDFILMNAAALLVVAGKTSDCIEAVNIARQSMEQGGARNALREIRNAFYKAADDSRVDDDDE